MCVAIYKPAGVSLTRTDLFMAYQENPDGCGLAIRQGKRITIQKGLWTWEDFLGKYESVEQHEIVVHFRWATSGKIGAAQCHPFLVPDSKVAVAHNGHFAGYGDKSRSDTMHWVAQWLAEALTQRQWSELPQHIAQHWPRQKLILLPSQGEPLLIGDGDWHGGAWWSNRNFTLPRVSAMGVWNDAGETLEQMRACLELALWEMDTAAYENGAVAPGLHATEEALRLCMDLIDEQEQLTR